MQEIYTALNEFATGVPWGTLLTFIGASGGLSALMTPVSRKLKNSHDLTKLLLVFIAGTTVATVNYLMHTTSQDPNIVFVQGALLTFMAQPFYLAILKPTAIWFGGQLAKATAYDEQVKSAAVEVPTPAPLVPTTPTTTAVEFPH